MIFNPNEFGLDALKFSIPFPFTPFVKASPLLGRPFELNIGVELFDEERTIPRLIASAELEKQEHTPFHPPTKDSGWLLVGVLPNICAFPEAVLMKLLLYVIPPIFNVLEKR